MSLLTDTIKKELDEARKTAAAGWQAFESYRKEKGDAEIAKTGDLFEEANRLHSVYGEAAEKARELEEKWLTAVKMDGGGDEADRIRDAQKRAAEGDLDIKGILGAMGVSNSLATLASKAADALVKSESYDEFRKNSAKLSEATQSGQLFAAADAIKRADLKTLLTGELMGQPVFLQPDRQAGIVQAWDRVVHVMTNLVTVGTTDNDTVDWISYDSYTNDAAETPEAVDADKAAGAAASTAPESAIALSRKSTTVEEIKHFIPATKRQLADEGQLRTLVDQELLWGLEDRLDSQLLTGDGVDPNLKGILNTAGLQTQARGADIQQEAIHKALTKLIISGYGNLGVLLNATDWQTIRLAKNANGDYYFGPPSISGGMNIWGYPVSLSQHLTAGTGIAADFRRSCTLWLRQGASLAATDTHSDWFLKGIVAILATMRCAFAVVRPRGVCTITGL